MKSGGRHLGDNFVNEFLSPHSKVALRQPLFPSDVSEKA